VLWQIGLDADGEVVRVDVRRARVRSTAQLDYPGLQRMLGEGSAPDAVVLLEQVGRLRTALARRRHAVNLDLPEQIVQPDGQDGWALATREPLPVETYNAEISLLTGMCAARLMLDAGYGILRTVPPADPAALRLLRRAARSLGIAWPDGQPPGDVLADLDRNDGKQVAFLEHAASLLRGAGYTTFDGAPPEQPMHAGIGAPYTHVTAPLRRLVDRYSSEICLAVHAKACVPTWVSERLAQLPGEMAEADRRAHEVDRAVVDMTEAWLLRDRIGERFTATVIDANEHAGTIVIDNPAVRARCDGDQLPVGERIAVVLTEADVDKRAVRFEATARAD
jgi:exoribonuclease R